MTDIVKGMVREYERAFLSAAGEAHTREEAMRAALLFLANNVSDEMVSEFWHQLYRCDEDVSTAEALAAAIRAAAGGEG
jgi:hypothetical protein